MRPIDADKLREELLEYEITIKRVNKNRISVKEQAILLDINAIVTNSPTVDAVPVVMINGYIIYGRKQENNDD